MTLMINTDGQYANSQWSLSYKQNQSVVEVLVKNCVFASVLSDYETNLEVGRGMGKTFIIFLAFPYLEFYLKYANEN